LCLHLTSASTPSPGVLPQPGSTHGDHVCVEARIPASTSGEVWRRVLAVLETADFFGLVSSARQGRIAWATVNKGEPGRRAGTTAQGHDCHMQGS